MADPDIDPAPMKQINDAMDALDAGLRQAKTDAARKRRLADTERDALAQQLFDFADQGRALAARWGRIAEARAETR